MRMASSTGSPPKALDVGTLGSIRRRAAAWRPPAALVAAIETLRREALPARSDQLTSPTGAVTPEQRLLQRISLGWNLAQQAWVEELGYEAYLDEQLYPESLDDSFLEATLLEALPTLSMSPYQIYRRFSEEPSVPIVELLLATLYRSIYSPRQLFERMVIFWSDHFNIDLFSAPGFLLKPTDDRDVIRRHCLGRFPELLWASAHSPAMLSYLTNDSNDKDHPNENYARELMELHTMGADRGYTEQDVKEVARCFTGWRFHGPASGPLLGRFYFDASRHDNGEKIVLGQLIPAGGGRSDGETVLRILAGRPETAEFIARKLLVYLWGYEPKPEAISDVARTYRLTGGDIRAMLRVCLAKPRIEEAPPKLKRPYHLMVSALRALFAEVSNPAFLFEYLLAAGHLPFAWTPPNGYPDNLGYWSGFLLPRWNYAATVILRSASELVSEPTPADAQDTADRVVSAIDRWLFNGTMSSGARSAVADFLQQKPITEGRVRDAFGLAIASPEFQSY